MAKTYGPQPLGVWAADILANVGAPHTQNNVNNLAAWWSCESARSGWGDSLGYNNIFNTEGYAQYRTGYVPTTTVPQFPNYNTGLWATLSVLKLPAYGGIIQALRDDAPRATFARAVGASGWGTNGACIAASATSAGIVAGTGLRPAGPSSAYQGGKIPGGKTAAAAAAGATGSGCASSAAAGHPYAGVVMFVVLCTLLYVYLLQRACKQRSTHVTSGACLQQPRPRRLKRPGRPSSRKTGFSRSDPGTSSKRATRCSTGARAPGSR